MRGDRGGAVAGLVLAAGSSSRMGLNKLLLELDGEPMVHRVVRHALAAHLCPTVVVLGHEAGMVRRALSGLDCRLVTNPQYGLGLNRSLRVGVAALPDDTAAVVVLLADMPLVTAEMLATLVDRYRQGGSRLVVSKYGEVIAPPMLYDHSLFHELGAPAGEGGGKRMVRRHRDEALTVPWPIETLTDLDRPGDYERMKALLVRR